MKSHLLLLFALILIGVGPAAAEAPPQWGLLEHGQYAVGFRSVVVPDASRTYGLRGAKTAAAQSRPIQISIWYPAQPSANAAQMPLGTYIFLRDRERSLADWSGAELKAALEREIVQLQRGGANESTIPERLASPTAAVRNAPPRPGRFPLIVFSPSMLATPQTNTIMCEYLASHGYVVAAHPSFGSAPQFMTTALRDLETQARDLEFVIAHMINTEAHVDASRIGLLGHSWGGLASVLVAARNRKIGAVASLDGSEEMWRDLLDHSPEFDPALFAVPYLRLHKPKAATDPDNGLFDSIRHAPTFRVVVDPSVQHFEFVSSQALSDWLRGGSELKEKQRVLALVSHCVRSFFDIFLRGDEAGREFLQDEAAGRQISEKLIAFQRGPALERAPADIEFLSLIVEGGWEAAQKLYRKAVEEDPGTFSERRMIRIGEMLLWTGQYNEAALAELECAAQRFPQSARAYEMIGNVYYWNLGEAEKALPYYQKAIQLDPKNLQVRTYLDQIKGSQGTTQ